MYGEVLLVQLKWSDIKLRWQWTFQIIKRKLVLNCPVRKTLNLGVQILVKFFFFFFFYIVRAEQKM